MAARRLSPAAVVVMLLGAAVATAADWGGVVPAQTTRDQVKARFGEPSQESKKKIEKYDSVEWAYDGDRAPAGMTRMVVEFGVQKEGRYVPDLVRTLRLDPKHGVFQRRHVILAWGKPDRAGLQDDVPVLIYNSGLTVYFDKDILNAVSMWFTAPLPPPEGTATAPAGASPRAR